MTIISRLAPTPSGFLHLGNVINFYLAWRMVRKKKGVLWLRIDDMDASRIRNDYVENIFHVLDWLGIDYDHGPSGPDDFFKNFSQQKKIAYYREKAHKLPDTFPCTCTRHQTNKKDSCRSKNQSFERMKTSLKIKNDALRDFVVWRKDDIPAYQLTSLIDDVDMNINTIIRGDDLKSSSRYQIFLAEKLGATGFLTTDFFYHKLVLKDTGQKLSKSGKNFIPISTSPRDVIRQIMEFEKETGGLYKESH